MHSRVRGTANAGAIRNYVERGIRVCDAWKRFDRFLVDMGPKPPGTWLDRIDNDGDYGPGNCRWATPTQQQRNRRSNRILEFMGEAHCIAEWGDRMGINRKSIEARLRNGWSVERTLTTPTRPQRSKEEIAWHPQ